MDTLDGLELVRLKLMANSTDVEVSKRIVIRRFVSLTLVMCSLICLSLAHDVLVLEF